MGRAQLKALLTAGASSIAFDARVAPDSRIAPFFDHALLKNVMLLKTVVGGKHGTGLQTRLYVPFDARQVGNGGKSLLFAGDVSRCTLETFFGVSKLDDSRIDGDLQKLAILAKDAQLLAVPAA